MTRRTIWKVLIALALVAASAVGLELWRRRGAPAGREEGPRFVLCPQHGGDEEALLAPDRDATECPEPDGMSGPHDPEVCARIKSAEMRKWAWNEITNHHLCQVWGPPPPWDELVRVGDAALPTLIDHIDDANALVRSNALDAIQEITSVRMATFTEVWCPHEECTAKRKMLIDDWREWLRTSRARPRWDIHLDHTRAHDLYACDALEDVGMMRVPEALPFLRAQLEVPEHRDAAILALFHSFDPQVIPHIISAHLESGDPQRRILGHWMLYEMTRQEDGLDHLATLKDGRPFVRWWTAWYQENGADLEYSDEEQRLVVRKENP